MNSFERLEDEACKDGIDVVSHKFKSQRIKGLYCSGIIGINKDIKTTAEKSCVLAEELGHHYTSVGDILDMSDTSNRKQEYRARLWAYDRMIGLSGIIKAYKARRMDSATEMADYLDVTEEFLMEALNCYKSKYGQCVRLGRYYIMFGPLAVIEKYDQIA